mmetsp:Transcript_31883/g.90555  ORF Transcript_31883/g.90555 Transcript_31883/m.90555 type:complete len:151 (-) Transcript_31883:87-539(-)
MTSVRNPGQKERHSLPEWSARMGSYAATIDMPPSQLVRDKFPGHETRMPYKSTGCEHCLISRNPYCNKVGAEEGEQLEEAAGNSSRAAHPEGTGNRNESIAPPCPGSTRHHTVERETGRDREAGRKRQHRGRGRGTLNVKVGGITERSAR